MHSDKGCQNQHYYFCTILFVKLFPLSSLWNTDYLCFIKKFKNQKPVKDILHKQAKDLSFKRVSFSSVMQTVTGPLK
jgi:hypothetical protein